MQLSRYRIQDTPKPFIMLSRRGAEVAMDWLASKEHGRPTFLPTMVLHVENLDDPKNGYYSVIYVTLRRRDRERARCGLSPYWEKMAHELEVNREASISRMARKAEEGS